MNYVDFVIAVSLFIFFFVAVIMFTTNYFSRYSGLTKTSELRPVAESLFNILLERKGVPEDWDLNYSISPVKVGLMEDLYKITILLEETSGYNRTNELISRHIVFDENCENKTWNNTIRVFDEDYNEFVYQLSDETFCSSQYLQEANITWEVNVSANQTKKFLIYHSPDDGVNPPSFTSNLTVAGVWHFDEGSGNITYDETGNDNDGTLYNGTQVSSQEPTWTSSCESGNCLHFNGFNDYVDAGNNVSLNITGEITISMWIKPNSTPTWPATGRFIDNACSNKGFVMWVTGSGAFHEIAFVIYNGTNVNVVTASLTLNQWHHVVGTFNGTTHTIYVNGSEIQSESFNDLGSCDTQILAIGSDNDGGNFWPFNGTIDEVYIWNRALTPEEINASYNASPLVKKTFPEEKIEAISYNKFDAMRNLSYDELKRTIGENYKLSVKIDGETYGGAVNQSANAVCYENPSIIQYKNGTVKKIIPKLCAWK